MGQLINEFEQVKHEKKAVHSLMEAACSIRHDFDSISSGFNISRPQIGVLSILKEAYPEGRSRGQIIDGLIEACPDVTRLIDRLAEDGLVERYRCREDARVSIAKITHKGLRVYENAIGAYLEYLEQIGKILTKKDCETLTKLCDKLSNVTAGCNRLEKSA